MHHGSLSEDQDPPEAENDTPLHAAVRKARRKLRQQREIRAAAASTTAPAPAASWTSSTTGAAATPAAAPAASSMSSTTAEAATPAEGLRLQKQPLLQVCSKAPIHRREPACFFCDLPIETQRIVAPSWPSSHLRQLTTPYLVYHQNCFSWTNHLRCRKRTGRVAQPREVICCGISEWNLEAKEKPLKCLADSDAESSD